VLESMPVRDQCTQPTHKVSVQNWPSSQTVSVANFPTTQDVRLTSITATDRIKTDLGQALDVAGAGNEFLRVRDTSPYAWPSPSPTPSGSPTTPPTSDGWTTYDREQLETVAVVGTRMSDSSIFAAALVIFLLAGLVVLGLPRMRGGSS
jgi:hypothetical protein